MNSEGKFWVSIWSIVGIFLLGIACSVNWSQTNRFKLLEELAAQGVSPMEYSCSTLSGGSRTQGLICDRWLENR